MPMNHSSTFLGLDAHKKTILANAVFPTSHGERCEWEIPNDERSLKRFARKLLKASGGDVQACYEAGCLGFSLKRRLDTLGIPCTVIAPSLIPAKPGDRVKTDRRDARKLAELFKAGLLTEVHPPSDQEEAVRDLTRARDAARRDRMSARHRILKMLLRYGFHYRNGKHWTGKHQQWLSALRFENQISQQVYDQYLFALEQIDERIRMLDAYIEEVSQSEVYAEPVGWLRCLRGVDTLTAMVLVSELHDIRRFGNPSELMSYVGLTPSEHSSSDRTARGGISKAGNKHVRRLLIESAQHYQHRPSVSMRLKKRRLGQPEAVIAIADQAQTRLNRRLRLLKDFYKKPHNVAVTAIARELVGYVWAILMHRYQSLEMSV